MLSKILRQTENSILGDFIAGVCIVIFSLGLPFILWGLSDDKPVAPVKTEAPEWLK